MLCAAQVVYITAIINHKFISFSAVEIYDLSYIHLQKNHCQVDKWQQNTRIVIYPVDNVIIIVT